MPFKDIEDHRAYQREYQRRWRAENREKARQISRDHDERNREKRRKRVREYRKGNLERHAETQRRRRELAASTMVAEFTYEQLQQRLSMYSGCWVCGNEATEVDHVKPLSKGGWHILANLRPICKPCNGKKWAKWPWSPSDS